MSLQLTIRWLAMSWVLALPLHAGVTFTTVIAFSGTNGSLPVSLTQSADGSFFGTTLGGGSIGSGDGTIFTMTADGVLTTELTCDGTNTSNPVGLVSSGDGSFYGTTEVGGEHNCGTTYRLGLDGTFNSLFSFNGTNGSEAGMLIRARNGYLYGTTAWGGIGYTGSVNSGYGTVFRVSTNGTFTTLASFNGTNGSRPYGFPLAEAVDGNFYGTTVIGGGGEGTIFKLSPLGELTTLFSFSETNGSGPLCIAIGDNGGLYGTTQAGGINDNGTLFCLSTNGTLSVLHKFTGLVDGGNPWSNLIRGQNGNFYGTTGRGGLGYGTIFEFAPGTGLTTLYSFTGGSNGETPWRLIQGSDGSFYGTTLGGGYGSGTIFRLTAPIAPAFKNIVQNGGVTRLTCSVVSGLTYQLQYLPDFSQTNWINLGTPLIATNGITTLQDFVGTEPQRFYRLVVVQ